MVLDGTVFWIATLLNRRILYICQSIQQLAGCTQETLFTKAQSNAILVLNSLGAALQRLSHKTHPAILTEQVVANERGGSESLGVGKFQINDLKLTH